MPFLESWLADASFLLCPGRFPVFIWEKCGRIGVSWIYFRSWFNFRAPGDFKWRSVVIIGVILVFPARLPRGQG